MASNSIIHKKTKQIDMDNFGISVWNGHKIMNYTSKTRLKTLKRDHYPSGTTMSDAKGTNRELKTKSTIKRSRSIKKVNTNQKEKKRNRNQ